MNQAEKDVANWAEAAFERWMDDCIWRFRSIGVNRQTTMAHISMIALAAFAAGAAAYEADEERLIAIVRRVFKDSKQRLTELKAELKEKGNDHG